MLHMESPILCHGFEPGILAGKLCIPDAQMPNAVYIPMPHPHHTVSPNTVMLYLMFVAYLHLDHYNVIFVIVYLHTPQAD